MGDILQDSSEIHRSNTLSGSSSLHLPLAHVVSQLLGLLLSGVTCNHVLISGLALGVLEWQWDPHSLHLFNQQFPFKHLLCARHRAGHSELCRKDKPNTMVFSLTESMVE